MTIDNYFRQPGCARFPFLFVITFGRSGSTLLQGILNSIPGYCIRGENNSTLFQLFNASCMHAEAHWDHGRKKTDTAHAWFGADLLDPKHFRRTLTDTFLQTCLRPGSDTRCTGFKEIRYTPNIIDDSQFSSYLQFLQTEFPGAALVFNVRRIDDVVRSAWWADQPPEAVRKLLIATVARFDAYAEAHPNCFIFDYDRLIDDSTYCAGLFDFLGEPFDPEALEAVLSKPHSYQPKPSGDDRNSVQQTPVPNPSPDLKSRPPERHRECLKAQSIQPDSDVSDVKVGRSGSEDAVRPKATSPRRFIQRLLRTGP